MTNVFAIVPARGGSKRIPDKNIALVNGMPLIAVTIKNLIRSNRLDSVYVSTDSEKIGEISINSGALCPFWRPKQLSDDFTPTIEVVKHAILELDSILDHDIVMCVYPTAVLISPSLFQSAIDFYLKQNFGVAFMLSVAEYSHPVERALIMDPESKVTFMQQQFMSSRTQDLQRTFFDAGQFYIGTRESWLSSTNIFDNAYGYEISRDSFIDIDYPEDLVRLRKRFDID